MLTGYGNQGGSESEPLSTGVGLNMRIQYWYDLDKKRVNEGYVVSNERAIPFVTGRGPFRNGLSSRIAPVLNNPIETAMPSSSRVSTKWIDMDWLPAIGVVDEPIAGELFPAPIALS